MVAQLPLTTMNFVLYCMDSVCMYTSRPNGNDIAFYVLLNKEI